MASAVNVRMNPAHCTSRYPHRECSPRSPLSLIYFHFQLAVKSCYGRISAISSHSLHCVEGNLSSYQHCDLHVFLLPLQSATAAWNLRYALSLPRLSLCLISIRLKLASKGFLFCVYQQLRVIVNRDFAKTCCLDS